MRGKIKVIKSTSGGVADLRRKIDAYDMADRVIIDSGPTAGDAQTVSIDVSDVALIVDDGEQDDFGGDLSTGSLGELFSETSIRSIIVRNRSSKGFPNVPRLGKSLRALKIPSTMNGYLQRVAAKADRFTVLCVVASKGGVGKSSVAAMLAIYWANQGEKVLIIDRDSQAGAISNVLQRGIVSDGDEVRWKGYDQKRTVPEEVSDV
jgi:cellulose biosynthesis protein BcsQ